MPMLCVRNWRAQSDVHTAALGCKQLHYIVIVSLRAKTYKPYQINCHRNRNITTWNFDARHTNSWSMYAAFTVARRFYSGLVRNRLIPATCISRGWSNILNADIPMVASTSVELLPLPYSGSPYSKGIRGVCIPFLFDWFTVNMITVPQYAYSTSSLRTSFSTRFQLWERVQPVNTAISIVPANCWGE